jgi:hypothetical protein
MRRRGKRSTAFLAKHAESAKTDLGSFRRISGGV